jgi:hypothetical protein
VSVDLLIPKRFNTSGFRNKVDINLYEKQQAYYIKVSSP